MSTPPAHHYHRCLPFDWSSYLAHRPDYTLSSFYPLLWSYHATHSTSWTLAHDIGTGIGDVASTLSHHFSAVIASDPCLVELERARKHNECTRISFLQSWAEEISKRSDECGEVDMITAANCVGMMDMDEAFVGFAEMLKPGGTLAVWEYGRPIFMGEGEERCQEIFNEIWKKTFELTSPPGCGPSEPDYTMAASWYDNVAFPAETWKDVRRVKWNWDRPMNFIVEGYFETKAEWVSKVGPDEEVERYIDRAFWAKEGCGIEWARGFVGAKFSTKRKPEGFETVLEPMWEELEAAMGGKMRIGWPVVLLLATRRQGEGVLDGKNTKLE